MKIAFFDIDGTLIDVAHNLAKPTARTLSALKEFQKQGNKIVIATARGEVPDSLKEIDFDGYICSDGHYIRYNNEVLVDQLFDATMVAKQLQVYQKYQGRTMFYGHEGSWCACLDDKLVIKHRLMFQGTAKRPEGVYEQFNNQDVKAISCCVLFDDVEKMWAAYHELENDFTIVPYDSGLIRMDVYCQGFTKGTACQYLYQKLEVDYEDTYAYGDGVNDIEMLKLVKHGIAMANGVTALKEVASEITAAVIDDGIALSFKKHFNIG